MTAKKPLRGSPLIFAISLTVIASEGCANRYPSPSDAIAVAENQLLTSSLKDLPGAWNQVDASGWPTQNRILISPHPRKFVMEDLVNAQSRTGDAVFCRIRKTAHNFRIRKAKDQTESSLTYFIDGQFDSADVVADFSTGPQASNCDAALANIRGTLGGNPKKFVKLLEFDLHSEGQLLGGDHLFKKIVSKGAKGCSDLEGIFADTGDIAKNQDWVIVQSTCDQITITQRDRGTSTDVSKVVIVTDGKTRLISETDQWTVSETANWSGTTLTVAHLTRRKLDGQSRSDSTTYLLDDMGDLSLTTSAQGNPAFDIHTRIRQVSP